MIKTIDLNERSVCREFAHRGVAKRLVPSIIALDPGQTTGWTYIVPSVAVMTEGLSLTDNIETFFHGQVDCGSKQGQLNTDHLDHVNPDGEANGVERLVGLCDLYPEAVIVVEDFIIDHRKITKDRSALSPVRITAKLEHEMWQRNRSIIIQDRANAKSSMNDKRLKEFGVYQRAGALQHARDSDRHALYFLRRCQTSADLRHKAWPAIFEEPVKKVRKTAPKKQGERIQFGR